MPVLRKPTRAAIRVLTILAYIEGAVTIVEKEHADPLILSKVEYVKDMCKRANSHWVVVGAKDWTAYKLGNTLIEITARLNGIWWLKDNQNMNYPGMCYIASQLVTDLQEIIKEPTKNRLLLNIADGLEVLVDYVDPEGEMFLTQERASEVTGAIYAAIGER